MTGGRWNFSSAADPGIDIGRPRVGTDPELFEVPEAAEMLLHLVGLGVADA